MPNCKNCGAEVDLDQSTCAWCGAENPAGGGGPSLKGPKPTPSPAPAPPTPAPTSSPTQSSTGSEMRVHKGTGPSVEDARKLAQMGDMSGALSLFNRILENQPTNAEALFGMGGVHFKQGDPKKAIENWLKLKVIDPNYPNLENWIGQARQQLPPTQPKRSASSLDVGADVRGVEEDWQRQSVKLSVEDEEKALAEESRPKPRAKPAPQPPELELEKVEGTVSPKPWVVPLGWGLILVYCVLIWLLYFSSWVRS